MMNKKRIEKFLIIIAVILSAVGGLGLSVYHRLNPGLYDHSGGHGNHGNASPAAAQKPLAELSLPSLSSLKLSDLSGKSMSFADIIGKTAKPRKVLVNFWATWCLPCLRELPLLEAADEQLGDDIKIIAITYEEAETVHPFIAENNINVDILLSSADIFGYMEKSGNAAMALPYTLLLDENESALARHLGDFKSLDEVLEFVSLD